MDTAEDTVPMVAKDSGMQIKKTTRFSTWFAIVFVLGFGVALLAMGGMQWNKQCDQPMKVYLVLHGICGVVASLFFLACEIMYLDSKDPDDDGSLRGTNLKIFYATVIYFVITGILGSSWYFGTDTCEDTAFTTYRWTWAAVLLFLILATMMFSDLFGRLGGPFFAKVGHVIGSIFQMLADAFNTLADVLEDGPKDPENVPPKRSGAAVFGIYVNHAAFLWFFLYIFFEAWKERNKECDEPLRTFLYVFSVTGFTVTYAHFLYELFAGVKTRQKIAAKQKVIAGTILAAYVIWGFVGFDWVHSSETCKDDGNAVNTYRISYLLTLLLLVLCLLLALFLCLGLLDFLCSGKMRFVVVISTGDDDEDEDDDLQ